MKYEITLTAIDEPVEVGYVANMPTTPTIQAMPGHRNTPEDAVRMLREGGRTFRM